MSQNINGIDYIESLYSQYNLFSVSVNGRKSYEKEMDRQLVYGEVKLHEIDSILKELSLSKDTHFIDCGSGAGKITLYTHYLNIFRQCTGIELVSTLHSLAEEVKGTYLSKIGREDQLQFLHSDFFDISYDAQCCVYINSTCFNADTCDRLLNKFVHLDKGSVIISTKRFNHHHKFKYLYCRKNVQASWGDTCLHIMQKQ
ncbi:MAG: hypothetical protein ACON35_08725 [Candidatus Marinamargulisbacteria bacterium]